jgi:hypothetical protein
VDDGVEARSVDRPISAGAVGALVAFLDTSGFDRRRFRAVNRLRALRDSEQFETLPEDLRQRVREIVADTDR